MKKFFGGTFIEKEKLKEAGIEHPIKLEYYKIINEDESGNSNQYGVNIVKTEYIDNDIKVEEKTIEYLSNNEQKVNDILIDSKIPKEQKDLVPIMVDSKNKVLWVLGLKKSKYAIEKNGNYDIIYKYTKEEE